MAVKLSTSLSGVAGEYFVAAELSRLGYIASLTLKNTRGIDIQASNLQATKTVQIQVKTNQGNSRWWLLHEKSEEFHSKNLFYVLVNLNNGKPPDYFIVPSKIVATYVKDNHKKWLATVGKTGQPHKDNPLREFKDLEGKYLNKWEKLGLN